jgi:hypothetical protein
MSSKIKLLRILLITGLIAVTQTAGMTDDQTSTPVSPTITPALSQTQKPFVPKTQSDLSIVTGNIQRPNGIAWYENKLYTVCSGDWTLYAIDPASGNTTQYIYGIKNAHTLYAATKDDKLSLWIPDFQSNALVNIYEGVASTVASNLQGPWGITNIDAQTFGVTNLSGNSVTLITDTGDIKEVISKLRSPTGITSDDKYVYVANTGSTRRAIEWFDKSSVLKAETSIDSSDAAMPLVSGLQNITDLSLGSDDLLYFSYSLGTRGVVGRVDPEICRKNGGCTSDAVEIVLYTELPSPLAGLTITPDMKLYIHSIFSPEIYWVQLEANTQATT